MKEICYTIKMNQENDLYKALLSLDRLAINSIYRAAGETCSPVEIMEKLFTPALERIGEDWFLGKVSLSQVYMSSRICEEIVNRDLPADMPRPVAAHPDMAITVLNDHHALGKKIVHAILTATGFNVLDYGQGTGVEELVARIREDRIRILLISTLMLRSALQVSNLKARLKEEELQVTIIVGGAPFLFDRELWKEVGADMMISQASEVVPALKNIIRKMN
ncbi:MAG: cobalamin-binding protein [Thermodesulfovibrio sp.]|nr:cobalamin-binding protein [Thermodesulfovibrio sp.]